MVTLPLVILRTPVKASTSSDWPLPSTPAIPRISPALTSKLTPCSTSRPRSESACRFSTCNITGPGWAGVLLTRKSTSRPTIMRAISAWFVSFVTSSPTFLPRRSTVMVSVSSSTSRNLCVIKMIVFPCCARPRKTPNSSKVSCGVKTPVGSSIIRISAAR